MQAATRLLRRVDVFLHHYWGLLALLCFLLILRLPNLCEPYWYGDEGIYLTLGNAMRYGERLYAEIIDHKTPLIYYLAMTPTQLGFRVLLIGWMIVSTIAFFILSKRLFSRSWLTYLSTFLFIVLTSLPTLEGNIPNGELFVMGFVLVGAVFLSQTRFFAYFMEKWRDRPPRHSHRAEMVYLAVAGMFFSLGILTKVPALFDVMAFLSLGWFRLTRSLETLDFRRWRTIRKELILVKDVTGHELLIFIGIVIPIILSIVYFVLRGSGQAYLDYGLLYNFRYAGSWNLPFTQPWLLWSFSLMGKAFIMAATILVITFCRRWLKPQFQFIATWSILALFASLLSNRPYPHYFLQVVPPFVLLLSAWLDTVIQPVKNWTVSKILPVLMATLITGLIFGLTVSAGLLLEFGAYPTISYYSRWVGLVTGRLSRDEYRESFNHLMKDNYMAADMIKDSGSPYLFIWGTNPMLYALSGTMPTGRFTVSFHIKDFQAYEETMQSVLDKEPPFIVVMKDEHTPLPGLDNYLSEHYIPNSNFQYFVLWMRR